MSCSEQSAPDNARTLLGERGRVTLGARGRNVILGRMHTWMKNSSVTLESVVSEHSTLDITVDGSELLVRPRGAFDSSESTRRVAVNRTDEDTAAYLVQDWMQRL
jgi:hypothetical protein